MKNRKLNSYIYNGWQIKDAIEDAVKNRDVILRYEKKLKNPNLLLDGETIKMPYLIGFGSNRAYKVKLSEEEAIYYLELEDKLNKEQKETTNVNKKS